MLAMNIDPKKLKGGAPSLQISMSLLIFTQDTDGELKALIQQRGPWDYEKNQKQTYAGAWQTAVHGKLENIWEGLARETREELGEDFAGHLESEEIIPMEHTEPKVDFRSVFHHFTFVPLDKLEKIKLHPSSSGWKLISESEAKNIQPLNPKIHRETGAPTEGLWMFQDEIDSLLSGFTFVKNHLDKANENDKA